MYTRRIRSVCDPAVIMSKSWRVNLQVFIAIVQLDTTSCRSGFSLPVNCCINLECLHSTWGNNPARGWININTPGYSWPNRRFTLAATETLCRQEFGEYRRYRPAHNPAANLLCNIFCHSIRVYCCTWHTRILSFFCRLRAQSIPACNGVRRCWACCCLLLATKICERRRTMICRQLLRNSLCLLICGLMVLVTTACVLICSAACVLTYSAAYSLNYDVKCLFVDVIPDKFCFIEGHVYDQEALLSESWPGAWICIIGTNSFE